MKRGGKNRHVVYIAIMSALSGLICAIPAVAAITASGDIDPTYDSSDPWSISGDLILGAVAGANLVISAGSRVQNDRGFIGRSSDTLALAAAIVTGSGSSWQNRSYLAIGDTGRGRLRVEDGAQVTDANAFVGWKAGGNGLVEVTGSGSTWDAGEELHVGVIGEATLYLDRGGRVTNRTGVLGTEATGTGVVIVTGPDSVWENAFVWDHPVLLEGHGGDLYVGQSGSGTLRIGSGGRVISQTSSVGQNATGEGEVVVDGSGTLWDNNTTMEVGRAGIGRLWIRNGGKILTREAAVAVEPGSEGQITIEGPGSELEVEWGMILGSRGNASMSVSGGGRVQTMSVTMGAETGSTATVSITGANSGWTGWGSVYVGDHGRAELLVSEGAGVYAQGITAIGAGAGGIGTATVAGAHSYVGGDALEVGIGGGRGRLTITDGAWAGGSEAWVGTGQESLGEVVVSGPGSSWGATYNFWIGFYGEGRLTVADGAQVETLHGFLGWGSGSNGSIVVTGPDSLLQTSHTLYVGGDEHGPGGRASLGIFDGGVVDGNSVTIWSTGIVAGDGTLRANEVINRGAIRPGSSIGTLTVDGDMTFEPNSVLETEVDNGGNSDKLHVTGDVTIRGGTVKAISTETITGAKQYTIVDANKVTGRFDSLDTALLYTSMVDPSAGLDYTANTVLLRVDAVPFDAFDHGIGRTRNERAVGSAFQTIAEGGGNTITHDLQQLPTVDEVRHSYDQLAGQSRPPLAPIALADSTKFVGTVANRLAGVAQGSGDRPLSAMVHPDNTFGAGTACDVHPGDYTFAFGNGAPYLADQNWGVWGKLYGVYGDRETENGLPGYAFRVFGQSFGLDYQLTERLLAGFTGGFSQGGIDFADLADRSEIDGKHMGVYGIYDGSSWYLNSVLTYSWLDFETRRVVDLMAERLEGDFDGDELTGYFEAGLHWQPRAAWLVQPLASFQFSYLSLDGYRETGGVSALVYADQNYESYKGSLGVRATKELLADANGCYVAAQVRGRWIHEFGDARSNVDAHFASSPGVVFTVSDEDLVRDSAVLGTGISAGVSKGLRLFADYDTSLNPDNTIHVISGALEYRW